jgi:hypothetical protein
MRVDPSGTYSPIPSTPAAAPPAAKPDAGAAPAADSSFAPTDDLARLLAAVRKLPDVRADVVQQVSDRLSAQTTPQAAADTAGSLLDSGDL